MIAALDAMIAASRQPVRLSLDIGSQYRSRAFGAWAADRGVALACLPSSKPIQNAHIENFYGHLRDACLRRHYFRSVDDARFRIARRRRT